MRPAYNDWIRVIGKLRIGLKFVNKGLEVRFHFGVLNTITPHICKYIDIFIILILLLKGR